MVLREGLVALVVALPFGVGAALGAAESPGRAEFRFADPAIVESSGLVVAGGLVVTVNDSGDSARVFTVDPADGRTVGVTRWAGEPVDVEALAPAGPGEVWVGDIGDNATGRDTIRVTRVPVGRGERRVEGVAYDLAYPDGAVDAEALLAHPDTGRLLVVTKGVLGGRIYTAPKQLRADRVNRLRPLGRVMPLVTDGAFLPDGRHLVLRDYGRAVVHTFPQLVEVGGVRLPEQQQGEGLAVTGGDRLLVSTEGRHAAVHEVAPPAGVHSDRPPAVPAAPDTDPASPATGPQLPEEQPGPRDPTRWLFGLGLGVVALVVLVVSLRPR